MIILNEAKPKYEKLDELLENHMMDIRFSNQVNMIIDLKEILKKFFRPDINIQNYSIQTVCEEVSSDIFSTVGHYRNYFYKKGKYTNFYILDSMSKSKELDELYPGYRKDFYDKYIFKGDNVDLTKLNDDEFKKLVLSKIRQIVVKGLRAFPHVYTIDSSDYGDVVYSKMIIQNCRDNEYIFILSNDVMLFQLVSKNVAIITPKGIKSELITSDNLYMSITNKEDVKFSSNLYPLVLSIAGVKKYNITNISGFAINKALSAVTTLLEKELISDVDSIVIPIEFSKLSENDKLERILIKNRELICKNYDIIRGDILLSKHRSVITSNISHFNRKYSIDELKKLNEKVFKNFPLQLDMLLKGEQIL